MTTTAAGSQVEILRIPEVTWGTTPATPTGVFTRFTGTTLDPQRGSFESKEMRSDRQTADVRLGILTGAGDIDFELSAGAMDDYFAAALGGAWTAVATMTTASVAVDGVALTFTRATGSFITDGFAVGQSITTTGFTNGGNNGTFLISAVTATVITCSTAVGLVTEVSAAGRTIVTADARVLIGATRQSFSLEVGHPDIGQYLKYLGTLVDKLSLDFKPEGIVTGKMSLLAKSVASATSSIFGSTTAAPTDSPMDTFSGYLKLGGTTIATVTAASISLNNGIETAKVLGQNSLADAVMGRAAISGSISALFQDATMQDLFLNETETSLEVKAAFGTKSYAFKMDRIKFTGTKKPIKKEGLISIDMPFLALAPTSGTNTTLKITRHLV